jgi:hypothetical protein
MQGCPSLGGFNVTKFRSLILAAVALTVLAGSVVPAQAARHHRRHHHRHHR